MKTTVSNLTLPDSQSDYSVLPFATPRIETGNYSLFISATITPESSSLSQAFIKPTFGMDGAPVLSAAEVRQIVFHGADNLSYAGGLQTQTATAMNEQGLDASVGGKCQLITAGSITVSAAGYLSMAFGGEAGWTLDDCVIDIEPN